FVGSKDEPRLARADMEEQRLDLHVVVAQQHLLQALVELAAVEAAGDDPRHERRSGGAGEEHQHLPPDQLEDGDERVLVGELDGVVVTTRPAEAGHSAAASAVASASASASRSS